VCVCVSVCVCVCVCVCVSPSLCICMCREREREREKEGPNAINAQAKKGAQAAARTRRYMCPHTTLYVSSYCSIFTAGQRRNAQTSRAQGAPAAVCTRGSSFVYARTMPPVIPPIRRASMLLYVSSYYYVCVRVTTICVSSYYYIFYNASCYTSSSAGKYEDTDSRIRTHTL
jgi:hypothetical protein